MTSFPTGILQTCPFCHSPLILYRSAKQKRFARCRCPDISNSIPFPRHGEIVVTDHICQLKHMLIFRINSYGRSYFWTDSPCFACHCHADCPDLAKLTYHPKVPHSS